MAKISNIGSPLDLDIRQGATFGPVRHTLRNPDGSLMNLTGATPRGQIRRNVADPNPPIASFTISMPSPTEGWYEFSLTAAVTAGITAGLSIDDPASRYFYDIELEDAAGRVIELLYGAIRVKTEVTRA